jgi:hypothetical protein
LTVVRRHLPDTDDQGYNKKGRDEEGYDLAMPAMQQLLPERITMPHMLMTVHIPPLPRIPHVCRIVKRLSYVHCSPDSGSRQLVS